MWSTIILTCASCAVLVAAQSDYSLPTVDMGHTVHQAISTDAAGQYYNFSNIRYAEPPTGNLRFAAPVSPKPDRTIQRGEVARICPQAGPAWGLRVPGFLEAYLRGDLSAFNTSQPGSSDSSSPPDLSQLPQPDPRETEDCLFLDVIVPRAIFDRRGRGKGAPVLVWIHGGGYVQSEKGGQGSPAGLIARSQDQKSDGIIFVRLNYRLGAFGFLAGSVLEASGGVSNAGLLDQRLALEWVKANIKFFGGDPKQVTVMGESAGGGSIMHHLTANGGRGSPLPFQQAILQSPGFEPILSREQQDQTLQTFFKYLQVTSLEEARAKPASDVQRANAIHVGLATYGAFIYGPVVDGTYVTDLPGKLLAQGSFAKNVNVMAGHNTNEGLTFTPPFVRTDDDYINYLKTRLPRASEEVINFIAQKLYPPVFSGQAGYVDQIQRTAATLGDLGFSCNTNFLGRAYGNKTYNYFFSVPPALHGADVPYTFYNGATTENPVAIALQQYITSFAMNGNPNEQGVPVFNLYGPNAGVQNLNNTLIGEIRDPAADERCAWWQQALFA